MLAVELYILSPDVHDNLCLKKQLLWFFLRSDLVHSAMNCVRCGYLQVDRCFLL